MSLLRTLARRWCAFLLAAVVVTVAGDEQPLFSCSVSDVYFLKMRKAGSTTLIDLLSSVSQSSSSGSSRNASIAASAPTLSVRALDGHHQAHRDYTALNRRCLPPNLVPPTMAANAFARPPVLVTHLREPIARLVSEFYFTGGERHLPTSLFDRRGRRSTDRSTVRRRQRRWRRLTPSLWSSSPALSRRAPPRRRARGGGAKPSASITRRLSPPRRRDVVRAAAAQGLAASCGRRGRARSTGSGCAGRRGARRSRAPWYRARASSGGPSRGSRRRRSCPTTTRACSPATAARAAGSPPTRGCAACSAARSSSSTRCEATRCEAGGCEVRSARWMVRAVGAAVGGGATTGSGAAPTTRVTNRARPQSIASPPARVAK